MTPVFIFSLPRSGSTLLQRLLANHSEIATAAEPWVLLPLVYMRKNTGVLSEYSHATSIKAVKEFSSKLHIKNGFNNLLSEFVLNLYKGTTTGSEKFFIDKTPRYYYIIDEIVELFPNAKFIFLFRNPAQVFSSVLTTWCGNKFFKLYRNRHDLFLGPTLLTQAYEKHKEQAISINYADLVTDEKQCLKKLYAYLGLSGDHHQMLDAGLPKLVSGEMGDKTGQLNYEEISIQPLDKWKFTFSTQLRKWYLKRYIHLLGNGVAQSHGYVVAELEREIDAIPNSGKWPILKDLAGIIYQSAVYRYQLNIFLSSKYRKTDFGFYD